MGTDYKPTFNEFLKQAPRSPEKEKLAIELSQLRCQLLSLKKRLADAPRGVSCRVDFDAKEWTFSISPECRVAGGRYALVWVGKEL